MFRVCLLTVASLGVLARADTLGFVEQKFSYISFEKGKWDRAVQTPCSLYSARQDGAVVEILRIGAGNLVPFKAAKGMTVRVCGDAASFDEGFEAGPPVVGRSGAKQEH